MTQKKVGIIGFGHLGSALSDGLSRAGYEVWINNGTKRRTLQKLRSAKKEYCKVSSLEEIGTHCPILVLCIKHDQLPIVGPELNSFLNKDSVVISCLAQATQEEVQPFFSSANCSVVKVMTTLAIRTNQGVSAYQLITSHDREREALVREFLEDISAQNCIFKLSTEKEIQLFTTLVGCFPGFISHLLSQLESSAYKYGGQKFKNYGQTLSTLLRTSADLLDDAGSTRKLEKKVKTAGGVTEAMIHSLSTSNITEAIDQAILAGLHKMGSGAKKLR
jgi:pyrroline-5-carboxylate reductase